MVKKQNEAGKWEDLPIELLVDILERVGVGWLLVDVPFVCKSWYKASLDPLCWKKLFFPFLWPYQSPHDPFVERFQSHYGVEGKISETKFVKAIIDRSAGLATMVDLNFFCNEAVINYVADKCPALKKLVVCPEVQSCMVALSLVIGKFKNLESLKIEGDFLFKETVTEIGSQCKNFVDLQWICSMSTFIDEEAMAIVNWLPKIKRLALPWVWIERENLILILKGCTELVYLDVRGCRGFDEDDEEILKLASHITTFHCSGSLHSHGYV